MQEPDRVQTDAELRDALKRMGGKLGKRADRRRIVRPVPRDQAQAELDARAESDKARGWVRRGTPSRRRAVKAAKRARRNAGPGLP